MHSNYQPLVAALDALYQAIATNKEKRSLLELSGWNFPALDSVDFCYFVSDLKNYILKNSDDEGDSELNVVEIVKRLNLLQTHTVPQLFSGNGNQAAPALVLSLQGMEKWVKDFWPEKIELEPNTVPYKVARQARTALTRLEQATSSIQGIEEKLSVIIDAHTAAEALPTDLEELRQLRASMLSASQQATADKESISSDRVAARKELEEIERENVLAEQLVRNCEEAYRITTTKGLSAAFAQRAFRLSASMWVWVVGLIGALLSVALIGHDRIAALSALISEDPKWGIVILNLVLSALSVGAPLWFAWVATKQIGQRFRLAEDYGYKASIAKAYEGYRKEAARIDEKFEAELFSIALSRLDEAPLRMVENETHGSPYHELLATAKSDPSAAKEILQAFKSRLIKKPSQEGSDEVKAEQ